MTFARTAIAKDDWMPHAVTQARESTTAAGLPAHEVLYRALRDMVLFGALAPGDPVTIQGLVDRMGAGMTPVREALRRLTAEGALESMGNRRICVPVLDAAAIDDLTEARLAIEPRLAMRAAQRIANPAIDALKTIDARLDRAITRGDVEAYLRENYAFHASLNAQAEAPVLSSLTNTLWLRFGPSLRVVCGQEGTHALRDLHKEMIIALDRNDPDMAAQAIEEDIHQGMTLIRQAIPAQI